MTNYPTIASCNYESLDDDTIHRSRCASDDLSDCPGELDEALEALEAVLDDELSESGEHRRGQLSADAIDAAESDVVAAYGDGPDGATWYGGGWVANSDDGVRWSRPRIYRVSACFRRNGQTIVCDEPEVLGDCAGVLYATEEEAIEAAEVALEGVDDAIAAGDLDETTTVEVLCGRVTVWESR